MSRMQRKPERHSCIGNHKIVFIVFVCQAVTATPRRVAVSDYMRRFCSHLGMNQKESRACTDVADSAVPREGTTR